MSSLGAVPGYAYPQLAYQESEFYQNVTPGFVSGFNQSVNLVVASANDGAALYPRTVIATINCSAVVGNRAMILLLEDGDGNIIADFQSPKIPTASTGTLHEWSSMLSAQFSTSDRGYSPMPDMVMPTGFSVVIACTNIQAGDSILATRVTGIRIPTAVTQQYTPPAVAAPLFT